jgi:hypothetical protein
LGFSVHPLHISVTEIEYDPKEKELEILIRVFTSDLEKAIRIEEGKQDLDILSPESGRSSKELFSKYFLSHFSVGLDGKEKECKFLGFEVEGQTLTAYIQVIPVNNWKEIRINNSLLVDVFDDQSNLVHVTVGKEVKSLRLVSDTRKGTLIFD